MSGVDLSGLQLIETNFTGANLKGANLGGVNLSGANLTDADLTGADIIGANLNAVDLSGANLSSANLTFASLHNANLSNVNLENGNLTEAYFFGVNFTGVNLSGAIYGDNLSQAQLDSAIINETPLSLNSDNVKPSYTWDLTSAFSNSYFTQDSILEFEIDRSEMFGNAFSQSLRDYGFSGSYGHSGPFVSPSSIQTQADYDLL